MATRYSSQTCRELVEGAAPRPSYGDRKALGTREEVGYILMQDRTFLTWLLRLLWPHAPGC